MNDNRPINAPQEFKADPNLHVHPTDKPCCDDEKHHGVLHNVKEGVKEGVKDVVNKVKGRDSSPSENDGTADYYQKTNINAKNEHVNTY